MTLFQFSPVPELELDSLPLSDSGSVQMYSLALVLELRHLRPYHDIEFEYLHKL